MYKLLSYKKILLSISIFSCVPSFGFSNQHIDPLFVKKNFFQKIALLPQKLRKKRIRLQDKFNLALELRSLIQNFSQKRKPEYAFVQSTNPILPMEFSYNTEDHSPYSSPLYQIKKWVFTLIGDIAIMGVSIVYKPRAPLFRGYEYYKCLKIIQEQQILEGDILLRRFDYYLDQRFIPGDLNHGGIYV
ncbi:hypothetical protein MJH12_03445 [bacterium]|nr:hypothetical protein [bacterium]